MTDCKVAIEMTVYEVTLDEDGEIKSKYSFLLKDNERVKETLRELEEGAKRKDFALGTETSFTYTLKEVVI